MSAVPPYSVFACAHDKPKHLRRSPFLSLDLIAVLLRWCEATNKQLYKCVRINTRRSPR